VKAFAVYNLAIANAVVTLGLLTEYVGCKRQGFLKDTASHMPDRWLRLSVSDKL
jgi:hypothetical protein